jgi:hypothetical protein
VVAPWSDLGQGIAGFEGIPQLAGFGRLEPGNPWGYVLTHAQPWTNTAVIVGTSTAFLPFQGDVLVPDSEAPRGLALSNATGGMGS